MIAKQDSDKLVTEQVVATCFCTKCETHKPLQDFHKTRINVSRTNGQCTECWNRYMRNYRAKREGRATAETQTEQLAKVFAELIPLMDALSQQLASPLDTSALKRAAAPFIGLGKAQPPESMPEVPAEPEPKPEPEPEPKPKPERPITGYEGAADVCSPAHRARCAVKDDMDEAF